MKLVIAIIQPSRLEAVKAALSEFEVFRLTVLDVQGFSSKKAKRKSIEDMKLQSICCEKWSSRSPSMRNLSEPTIQAIIQGERTDGWRQRSATERSLCSRWTDTHSNSDRGAGGRSDLKSRGRGVRRIANDNEPHLTARRMAPAKCEVASHRAIVRGANRRRVVRKEPAAAGSFVPRTTEMAFEIEYSVGIATFGQLQIGKTLD